MTRTIRDRRRVSPGAPRRVANRTAAGVEAQVLEVRTRLEANPWAQVGPPAIAWELSKLGAVVPPERTIEQILARAGATKRQRRARRASKGVPYPAPVAARAGEVGQVDLVGPRHLDGGVLPCAEPDRRRLHHAGIEIVEDRSDRTVLVALHALWGRHGVPGRIQFDNGGPFVSPTGLGEVVRVCLRQGSTPVFLRPREPWRNGTIEHFNDTFDKRFFRQERFADVQHLTKRAGAFERFHNAQHRYSATRSLTPELTTASTPPGPIALADLPAGWPAQGAPTSTSSPRLTSRSPARRTTSSSQATRASCSPPHSCRSPPLIPRSARPRAPARDATTAKTARLLER